MGIATRIMSRLVALYLSVEGFFRRAKGFEERMTPPHH